MRERERGGERRKEREREREREREEREWRMGWRVKYSTIKTIVLAGATAILSLGFESHDLTCTYNTMPYYV